MSWFRNQIQYSCRSIRSKAASATGSASTRSVRMTRYSKYSSKTDASNSESSPRKSYTASTSSSRSILCTPIWNLRTFWSHSSKDSDSWSTSKSSILEPVFSSLKSTPNCRRRRPSTCRQRYSNTSRRSRRTSRSCPISCTHGPSTSGLWASCFSSWYQAFHYTWATRVGLAEKFATRRRKESSRRTTRTSRQAYWPPLLATTAKSWSSSTRIWEAERRASSDFWVSRMTNCASADWIEIALSSTFSLKWSWSILFREKVHSKCYSMIFWEYMTSDFI